MPDETSQKSNEPQYKTIEERFWSNVNKDGPIPAHMPHLGQCWVWTTGKTDKGYGAFWRIEYPRGQVYAHRFSWMIHFGPIPAGKFVCHHCDVPSCVRPDHLFLDTPRGNTLDAIAKGRMPQNNGTPKPFKNLWKGKWKNRRGEGHEGHKLTDDKVREIRSSYVHGKVGYKFLGAKFGIHAMVVKRIILRQTWKHVD